MGKIYNIQPGDIYGRLTVVGKVGDAVDPNSCKHMSQYLCRCSCPNHNTVIVKGKNLVSGKTKSCGCLLRETASIVHSKNISPHEIQNYDSVRVIPNVIWAYYTMLYDAYNGVDQLYNQQIPVYSEWVSANIGNIRNFYESMFSTYSSGCKLQRIDKSIGFRPDNCYWGSRSSDPVDKINDRFIEYNGNTMSVSEWNMALGYKPDTIKNRILRGYSDIDAIIGKLDDFESANAIYYVNEYGRPLNRIAIEEMYE